MTSISAPKIRRTRGAVLLGRARHDSRLLRRLRVATKAGLEELEGTLAPGAEVAGKARGVVVSGEGSPADVVDQRPMDAEERARGDPRLDIFGGGAALLGEQCREGLGVAVEDLPLPRQQRGALHDDAGHRAQPLARGDGVVAFEPGEDTAGREQETC